MKRFVACSLVALCAASAVVLDAGCGKEEETQPTGSCQPTDPSCPAVGVPSDCLALVDNSGKDVFAVRLSQLSIQQPEALTATKFLIAYNLVANAVYLDLPQCNLRGEGTFSLLAEFDKPNGTLRVGSAVPEADPTTGFCFASAPAMNVGPVEVASNLQADGTFRTDPIAKFVVPIFLDLTGTSAVYLPLSQAVLTEAKLSADQNCVGSYNAQGLNPRFDCAPDPQAGQESFINGGQLEGHITLEEADAVIVEELNQSLCVLLSGDPNTYGTTDSPKLCTRDASNQIELQGDWCSQTDSAGGCRDSMRLVAGFAASAAEIRSDCPDPTGGGGAGGAGGGGTGGAGGN